MFLRIAILKFPVVIEPRISIPTGARIDILFPEEFTISTIIANDCTSTTDGGSPVTSTNCYKKNQKIFMLIASDPLVLGTDCKFKILNAKITTPTYGRYVQVKPNPFYTM